MGSQPMHFQTGTGTADTAKCFHTFAQEHAELLHLKMQMASF